MKNLQIIETRRQIMIILLMVIAVLIQPFNLEAKDMILVKAFGVAGDGKTDDSAAIHKAVKAAIKQGPGTTLVFEKKTYRLGPKRGQCQFKLSDVKGLTIDGKGSTLILHPRNGLLEMGKCKDVVFKGFVIDFDPLPYTQGTIQAIDKEKTTFDLELHESYPLPPTDAAVKKRYGRNAWCWGAVIDPKEKHRRWDVPFAYFIESVHLLKGRTYRISIAKHQAEGVALINKGDRFFLPLVMNSSGEAIRGMNISIRGSSDCTVEDVTIYASRSGMNYAIIGNEGRITMRDNKIAFKPGSTRVCTSWKDGMHCKDNRMGPLVEGCFFEGMLDDSINIGANTGMATKVISQTEFVLMGPAFSVGDKIMALDPQSGKRINTKVLESKRVRGGHLVKLAKPIKDVIPGFKKHAHLKSTQFYNMDYVNDSFIVRNCTFKAQRRHALLTRSSNGIFENNTVDSVGGAAVEMGNEMGNFYEGPFPTNNIIRNNIIRNTQTTAINIYTSPEINGKHTRDILVEGNTITVLPGHLAIAVSNAKNVKLKNNKILDQKGKDISKKAVQLDK